MALKEEQFLPLFFGLEKGEKSHLAFEPSLSPSTLLFFDMKRSYPKPIVKKKKKAKMKRGALLDYLTGGAAAKKILDANSVKEAEENSDVDSDFDELEEEGAKELVELGAESVRPLRRSVAFEADMSCFFHLLSLE